MKLKEKFQRFWTLSKSHKGFTLVELIVVIAILAILAGVAIPVYNGYIKKAQSAADEQLLDTINTAFAAACLSNGYSHVGAQASITVNADGTIGRAVTRAADAQYTYLDTVVIDGANVKDAVDADFAMFYGENKSAAFKGEQYIGQTLALDAEGKFVAVGGRTPVTYNGQTYYVNQSAIDAFNNSVFKDNITDMQGQVDTLAGFFGEFVGTKENAAIFGEDFVEFLTDNNIADADIGNAAVLYIAQNSTGVKAEDIANKFGQAGAALSNGGSLMDALTAVSKDGGDPLTNAAMMYAAVTGFANSDKCTDQAFKDSVKNVNDANSLLGVFTSLQTNAEWGAYLGNYKQDGSGEIIATEQFTNDVSGFIGAMDAINTISPDVANGGDDFWSSDAINDILNQLLGSN